MREFKVKTGNFIKSPNSTRKMMYHVIISLIPIILFAFYKNGILPIIKGSGELLDIFKPILLIIVPVITCIITEYLFNNYYKCYMV